jgi:glycosyltransferase involved in cell wall biosynthesis
VDGSAVRRERGWNKRVVYLHSGAMGRVNGLDVIVRAAEHFRNEPDILFVLMGEGKERAKLVEQRDRLGLDNLQIVDGVPKEALPAIVAAADVGLVTVTNVPVLQDNSANKFFDYLSAGKPVLINYGGWQREVLESASAGLGCEQGDDEAFFANIAALKTDANRRAAMGRRAHELALRDFDRGKLAAQALDVITHACGCDETS